jgi:uncharacterized protein (TIGR02145 family)
MKKTPVIIGTLIALLATGLAAQEKKNDAPVGNTVTDIDGNVYKTVTIGSQVWMAENLKTTRYRNGDVIGTTSPALLDISRERAPKYQWVYVGWHSDLATYGRLYTWYAVTDSRNIAPAGWHVPTDAEWTTLTDCLGGESVAGGKLKETGTTHWKSPNTDASNESGFTALPGGLRWATGAFEGDGNFNGDGHHGGCWWSSSGNNINAWSRTLVYLNSKLLREDIHSKSSGFSVRCVKDASTLPSASHAAQADKNPAPAEIQLNNGKKP